MAALALMPHVVAADDTSRAAKVEQILRLTDGDQSMVEVLENMRKQSSL